MDLETLVASASSAKSSKPSGKRKFMTKSQLRAQRLAEEDKKAAEDEAERDAKRRRREKEREEAKRADRKARGLGLEGGEGGGEGKGKQEGRGGKEEEESAASASASARAEVEVTAEKMKAEGATLAQVRKRLRSHGLPVRVFGEGEMGPYVRLATFDRATAVAGANEFMQKGVGGMFTEEAGGSKPYVIGGEELGDADSAKKSLEALPPPPEEPAFGDPNDKAKVVYQFFKSTLKAWEAALEARPDEVRRTAAGKSETISQKQCKDYVKPLFKSLKDRSIEPGMLLSLHTIVNHCKAGEFVKANDTYIDVAIGRAAWPIGVTMVGIHARAGREKIDEHKVAHVMNSELQRKWLTSVKRLMTFAQERSDADPSKKVQF